MYFNWLHLTLNPTFCNSTSRDIAPPLSGWMWALVRTCSDAGQNTCVLPHLAFCGAIATVQYLGDSTHTHRG